VAIEKKALSLARQYLQSAFNKHLADARKKVSSYKISPKERTRLANLPIGAGGYLAIDRDELIPDHTVTNVDELAHHFECNGDDPTYQIRHFRQEAERIVKVPKILTYDPPSTLDDFLVDEHEPPLLPMLGRAKRKDLHKGADLDFN
jgi:hypothetical protein